jgi:hypothetical protein
LLFLRGVLEPNPRDKQGTRILTELSQLAVNKGKVVAVCAIKAYRESRGKAVLIADTSTGSR